MAVLNIVIYTTLFVVNSLGTVHGVPVEIDENQWIADAQHSIKDSLSKVESYGVENEKIMTIAKEAFDTFTKSVENDLSTMIKQIDDIKSENLRGLKTQLMNWSDGLERLNNVSDVIEKTPNKAIEKFYITIDYISKEVIGFEQNYNLDSVESNEVVQQLKFLLKKSVAKLVEYASSVKDQVSGTSKIE